ncbi:hypothetical protein BYT27DRAFT_7287423 [Phlegmacium glaucopus]|nr:hypothetical protein BYT27DRAFT_7287423 [Phlegmacium glaucopus]
MSFPPSSPATQCVDHPLFIRLSPTQYMLKPPSSQLQTTLHVGQVADILKFDKQVRLCHGITALPHMPLGFTEFSVAWNTGARPHDERRISKVFLGDSASDNIIEASLNPVYLCEFHITAEQVGLGSDMATALQIEMAQELATMHIHKLKYERQGFYERQEKRLQAFTAKPSSNFPTMVHRSDFKMKRRPHKCYTPGDDSPLPTMGFSYNELFPPSSESYAAPTETFAEMEIAK